MKRNLNTISIILAFVLLGLPSIQSSTAQGHQHIGVQHSWPDSLEFVTVTGLITVDNNALHPAYYLDENNDGEVDYHLTLGPWWYAPESGADWPADGETVTVYGAVLGHSTPPNIVIFELNGLTWRTAIEYGDHGWHGGTFWQNGGEPTTATGTILIDTTYFYHHYFLDTDGDDLPDYRLSFGPIWYTPVGGLLRPQNGEVVTITGRTHTSPGINLLSVYTLNGQEWRASDGPPAWAGSWMSMNHPDTARVYCVNDSTNWIGFPPGHMRQGMGGMFWPDSMFVQFWRIHPDSLPGSHDEGRFLGFYLDMHDQSGNSMMNGTFGRRRGMMQFDGEHQLHFRYSDDDLHDHGLTEDGLSLQYWDTDMQQWRNHAGVFFDYQNNTVSLTSDDLNKYYALAAQSVATGTEHLSDGTPPARFVLFPNFPNPFNPTTKIRFELFQTGPVSVRIFNLLGEQVALVADRTMSAGTHELSWTADALPSGLYLIRIASGSDVNTQTATLLK